MDAKTWPAIVHVNRISLQPVHMQQSDITRIELKSVLDEEYHYKQAVQFVLASMQF